MTPDDWRLVFEGVIAVFAIAAFVLSLIGLAYTSWTGRAHVRVTLSVAYLPRVNGMATALMITAYNSGRTPVALTGCGADLYDQGKKGSSAFFLKRPPFDEPLPHVLQPGRSWSYHCDPIDLLEYHVSDRGPVLRPFVNDEGGHHWTGRSSRTLLDSFGRPG